MSHSLPDFVILGATDSATTRLRQSLQAHPQIFMPDRQLHYFSREFARGEAWYRAQFAAAAGRVIGERSASYLGHPDAPARLQALLPAARLVVVLRNPIERACSDYAMHVRRGQVAGDLARYLAPGSTPLPNPLEAGLYGRHLSALLERFASAQLEVILDDDLRRDPAPVYRSVCGHIGVAPEGDGMPFSGCLEHQETAVVRPLARRLLAPIKDAVEPLREHPAFRFARSLLAPRLDDPELTPWLWQQLRDYYRADIEALEAMLERDLGHWLLEPEREARPG